MLSNIHIAETIEVPYSGNQAAGFPIVKFDLPNNQPFLLSTINYTTTAGVATLLSSFIIKDNLGKRIFQLGIIPWQFANTTITNVMMQTPNPNNTALFFNNILAGFIPKDLHVFNNWTINFQTFMAIAGTSTSAIITLIKLSK